MTTGKMYDILGNEVTNQDLQNKGTWCKHGVNKENTFINLHGHQLRLIINPEKSRDIYAPDLTDLTGQDLADLKTQNTPFFTAIKYGYSPQTTVTFNKKDADRYRVKYPNIDIYFWVEWVAVKYFKNSTNKYYPDTDIQVVPMYGIWKVSFKDLDAIINKAPTHSYSKRVNDNKGNAKESYLINLMHPKIKRVI